MKIIQLYIIVFSLFSIPCNSQENIVVDQINPNLLFLLVEKRTRTALERQRLQKGVA